MSQLSLHTFYRSSSTARLRMALNLKGLSYTPVFVNLGKNEHNSDAYAKLNPSRTVPLLVHHAGSGDVSIGQSYAALEYLEECFPSTRPLLPGADDPAGRAFVRTLTNLVVADMQPVTSLRVQAALGELGVDRLAWTKRWTSNGLKAYEALLQSQTGNTFSYGDSITIADVCLTAAVWNALAVDLPLESYPKVRQVFEKMTQEKAVQDAYWQNQPDCPEDQKA